MRVVTTKELTERFVKAMCGEWPDVNEEQLRRAFRIIATTTALAAADSCRESLENSRRETEQAREQCREAELQASQLRAERLHFMASRDKANAELVDMIKELGRWHDIAADLEIAKDKERKRGDHLHRLLTTARNEGLSVSLLNDIDDALRGAS